MKLYRHTRRSRNIFLLTLVVLLGVVGCKKGNDIVQNPLIGEWNMTSITVGVFHDLGLELDVVETIPVDNGGVRFDSDYHGTFIGDDSPKWMPTKFTWETNADTLIMEFFGYEIKPLFNLQEGNDIDYLDLLFSTDSLGVISDQDTVLQMRMQR